MVNANSKFSIKCLKTEAGVILSTISQHDFTRVQRIFNEEQERVSND